MFWAQLAKLCQLIGPIHEAQKMSESTKSTLGHVIPRWNKILQELKAIVPMVPSLRDFIDNTFKARRKLQLRPIHTVAMFLLPENRTREMNATIDNTIMAFLWKRCHSDEEKKTVHKSFHSFRHKRDGFDMSTAWIHRDDPTSFWQTFLSIEDHKLLARIAITIFETPANSVASERAFSCMGLITNALRNRLLAERATKLIYIHMNQRVLDNNTTFADWQESTEEEKVELEKLLTEMKEEEAGEDEKEEVQNREDIELEEDNDVDMGDIPIA